MRRCYADILERVPEDPYWFDEHAVPRYCAFSPNVVANIYADECALVLIACQSCHEQFKVAFSWHPWAFGRQSKSLSEQLAESGTLYFGDPPNVGCCPAGPTMSSDSLRVLEFWTYPAGGEWTRVPALERDLDLDTPTSMEQLSRDLRKAVEDFEAGVYERVPLEGEGHFTIRKKKV